MIGKLINSFEHEIREKKDAKGLGYTVTQDPRDNKHYTNFVIIVKCDGVKVGRKHVQVETDQNKLKKFMITDKWKHVNKIIADIFLLLDIYKRGMSNYLRFESTSLFDPHQDIHISTLFKIFRHLDKKEGK